MKKITQVFKKYFFVVCCVVLGILLDYFCIRYLKGKGVNPGIVTYVVVIIAGFSYAFTVIYVYAKTTLARILALTTMFALSYFEGCIMGLLIAVWYWMLKGIKFLFGFKLVRFAVGLGLLLLAITVGYYIYSKIKFNQIKERRKNKKNNP